MAPCCDLTLSTVFRIACRMCPLRADRARLLEPRGLTDTLPPRGKVTSGSKSPNTAGVHASVSIEGGGYALRLSGTRSERARHLVACACVFSAVLDDEVSNRSRPHTRLGPFVADPSWRGTWHLWRWSLSRPCLDQDRGGRFAMHRTHRSRPKSRIRRVVEPWEPHR
jgi:hypothetical protein